MKIVELLREALARRRAIAAFNAPSFDAMVGIGLASFDVGQPAIVQTSARFVMSEGASALKAQFDLARKQTGADLFLHLDHCSDDRLIGRCIDLGWDMVMFDGSHLPIGENVRRTGEIVRHAHAANVAVEAEVGSVGGEEDGIENVANYANTQDIVAICAQANPDCLAVGFGNVHGDYANKSLLRWEIFEKAQALVNCPLVLHGGSGLTKEEFQRAIFAGAAKINISTDLKKIYHAAMVNEDLQHTVLRSPTKLHDHLRSQICMVSKKYITLFSKDTNR